MYSIKTSTHTKQAGFTLVELAVTLIILALLIGGLIVPLSAQRSIRQNQETEQQLRTIQDALMGYVIIHKRLPCPSTTDTSLAQYGNDTYDSTLTPPCTLHIGTLPWKALGIPENDAYGSPWIYRPDTAFINTISLATTPNDGLTVRDINNNTLTATATNSVVAIIYSRGDDHTANGDNADSAADPDATTFQADEPTPNFDDKLIWIGQPLLVYHLLSAGQIP